MTAPHNPYYTEIIKLRYERDLARAELAEMRAAMLPPIHFPTQWNLSTTETKILLILSRRAGYFSNEGLYSLVYDSPANGPEQKIIGVFICKLRKKLRGTGIEIETLWGRGYQLSVGSHEIVARVWADSSQPNIPADQHRGAA